MNFRKHGNVYYCSQTRDFGKIAWFAGFIGNYRIINHIFGIQLAVHHLAMTEQYLALISLTRGFICKPTITNTTTNSVAIIRVV